MHLVRLIFAFVTATSLSAASGYAAEIDILRPPGFNYAWVVVTGEIAAGDAKRFREATEKLVRVTVVLNSPGGVISEAFGIGAEAHQRNFATMVLPEAECFSACALIWVAGERRYISEGSRIGVHAAYRLQGDSAEIVGAGNAEIGAYLTTLGLRREAVRYFTTAPPDDFLPLTPAIARTLGIDVFEQDGFKVITPDAAPSADRIAWRVSTLFTVAAACKQLFDIDAEKPIAEAEALLKRGHDLLGGAVFAEIIPLTIDVTRRELEEKGAVLWCLGAASELSAAGIKFGLDGPSFDCRKATNDAEETICRTMRLWAYDRTLAEHYSIARASALPEVRQRLVRDQRAWLQRRNACGTSVPCLAQRYTSRIIEISP